MFVRCIPKYNWIMSGPLSRAQGRKSMTWVSQGTGISAFTVLFAGDFLNNIGFRWACFSVCKCKGPLAGFRNTVSFCCSSFQEHIAEISYSEFLDDLISYDIIFRAKGAV